MASNQFLPFAVGGGANALTPAAYAALTSLLASGFQAGTASSAQINTVLRQASTMAAALGQLVSDQGGDALDNGSASTLKAALKAALDSLYGGRPGRTYTGSDWAWVDRPAGLFEQWFDCVYNGADGGAGTVITLPYAYTTGVLAFSACDVLNGVNACSIAPIDATKVRVWGRVHDGSYGNTTMHVRLIGR